MKKKLVYTLIFCIVLIGVDKCIGLFLEHQLTTLPDDGDRLAKINYAINKVKADIIVVGASDARTTINTQILKDSFTNYSIYNCGIDGQPTFVCDVVLNCILNRTVPKLVLWVVRPDALKDMKGQNDLSLLYPFYNNYYVKERLDCTDESFLRLKLLSKVYRFNGNALRIAKAKFFPDPTTYLGFTELDGDCTNMGNAEIEINQNFCVNESLKKSLMCTLERMQQMGIKVVFILTPKYCRNLTENQYVKMLDSVRSKYTNTYLIDDSQIDTLICNGKYFRDVEHLNAKGSQLYTKMLVNKIIHFMNNMNKSSNED